MVKCNECINYSRDNKCEISGKKMNPLYFADICPYYKHMSYKRIVIGK